MWLRIDTVAGFIVNTVMNLQVTLNSLKALVS
jgi:hypothetical protein